MTAARWRLVRDMHQTLCAEANVIGGREDFRVWYMQNCNGSLYHAMLGDNPSEEGYVDAHSIYRWLPGGPNEDAELVRLLELGDQEQSLIHISEPTRLLSMADWRGGV